jgi:hypothetical protein
MGPCILACCQAALREHRTGAATAYGDPNRCYVQCMTNGLALSSVAAGCCGPYTVGGDEAVGTAPHLFVWCLFVWCGATV